MTSIAGINFARVPKHIQKLQELMKYEGVVGESNHIEVEAFEIPEVDMGRARYMFDGRDSGYGTFHRLLINNCLWMSDTWTELSDHASPVLKAEGATCLVNGLGLGLVTSGMIRQHAVSVEVVEIDKPLIEFMSPWLIDLAEKHSVKLTIHHADAFDFKPAKNVKYDVVWHDIWKDICLDNKPEITKLKRKFGKRASWQGVWSERELAKQARRCW